MREETGNIWGHLARSVIAVTTNGTVTRDGRAVLGRGCASQAMSYFPGLRERLGKLIAANGNHVQVIAEGLVSFPVEETAWSLPDLRLISRSARELQELTDRERWGLVVIPRPGCGGGGMSWSEVRPAIAPFFDSRFVVVSIDKL